MKFYFALKHVKTGKEYYKTVVSKNMATAKALVTKYYPQFIIVAVKEL